jgi:hypothetical protein
MGKLCATEIDDVVVLQCSACAGHFVTHVAMEALNRGRKRSAFGGGYAPPRNPVGRTLHCPCCEEPMSTQYFAHGCAVLVDVCVEHGSWFDARELDIALDALSAGVKWGSPKGRKNVEPPSPRPAEPAPEDAASAVDLEGVARLARLIVAAAERGDLERVRSLAADLDARIARALG